MGRGLIVPARIVGNQRVARGISLISMMPLKPVEEPGPFQFYMVWMPGAEEVPMSVADWEKGIAKILVKERGPTTARMLRLASGDIVGLKGPLGRPLEVGGGRILGVAGGSGVAPFIYLARILGSRLTVVYGARSSEEVGLIPGILESLGARVLVATEDGSTGFKGTAVDLVGKLGLEEYDEVIAAGPTAMLKALGEKTLAEKRDPLVSLERMVKCGIGGCGSCSIPGTSLLLCVDGPVFRYSVVRESLDK